jgi:hypothetical protein
MDYEKDTAFFIDKSNDWFEYHHQLFVFSICEILNKIQCQYLLMHNYGNYPLENRKYCFSNFHHDKFLSRQSLTQLLTGRETAGTISPLELETTKKRHFSGVYFKGCIWHPNQRGHQKIADDILEKLSIKSNDAN